MAFLEKNLTLKRSLLPGAGKGLFAKADIPKGKIITQYKGSVHLWKDIKHLDGHNAYLFKISNKVVLNAEKYLSSFARYANDARGFSKITGLRNNAEYLVKKNECFIISIRKIHKGEEILVPYGKAYWDLMKKIHAEKNKKRRNNFYFQLYTSSGEKFIF